MNTLAGDLLARVIRLNKRATRLNPEQFAQVDVETLGCLTVFYLSKYQAARTPSPEVLTPITELTEIICSEIGQGDEVAEGLRKRIQQRISEWAYGLSNAFADCTTALFDIELHLESWKDAANLDKAVPLHSHNCGCNICRARRIARRTLRDTSPQEYRKRHEVK